MTTLLDTTYLFDKLEIEYPPVGIYDAPADSEFNPTIQPIPQKHTCIFAYFNAWKRGQTLQLTSTNYSCRGCGHWLFGKETRDRKSMVEIITQDEGLKCSKEITNRWLDYSTPYKPKYKTLFIGPLKSSMDNYLKTITLFVNPDQLSALIVAANYHHQPELPNPVSIPFGSGCMQILTILDTFEEPHAIVGSTDLAMRMYFPPNILAFTMNKAMFERICSIKENSFFEKPIFTDLKQQREK